MQKKTCPNGHVYDPSIYGDTCPLCPPPSAAQSMNQQVNPTVAAPIDAPHTKLATPGMNNAGMGVPPSGGYAAPAPSAAPFPGMQPQQDPRGNTVVAPHLRQQQQQQQPQQQQQASEAQRRTVIRHNPAMMGGAGAAAKSGEDSRKLVGFLVTYNRNPMGKAYNIYEGRNLVGRDASCDICVADDSQMSSKHMSIRYLSGNNKFRFHDEMSSNGTYVNKELLDDGELQNYDIIRVGSTLFIFIAIPQI